MKKLIVLSAVLLGASVASQAGINFHFSIGSSLPAYDPIISRPAPVVVAAPAPAVAAPQSACTTPAPIVTQSPACPEPTSYGTVGAAAYVPPPAPIVTPAPVCAEQAPVAVSPPTVVVQPAPVWYGGHYVHGRPWHGRPIHGYYAREHWEHRH